MTDCKVYPSTATAVKCTQTSVPIRSAPILDLVQDLPSDTAVLKNIKFGSALVDAVAEKFERGHAQEDEFSMAALLSGVRGIAFFPILGKVTVTYAWVGYILANTIHLLYLAVTFPAWLADISNMIAGGRNLEVQIAFGGLALTALVEGVACIVAQRSLHKLSVEALMMVALLGRKDQQKRLMKHFTRMLYACVLVPVPQMILLLLVIIASDGPLEEYFYVFLPLSLVQFPVSCVVAVSVLFAQLAGTYVDGVIDLLQLDTSLLDRDADLQMPKRNSPLHPDFWIDMMGTYWLLDKRLAFAATSLKTYFAIVTLTFVLRGACLFYVGVATAKTTPLFSAGLFFLLGCNMLSYIAALMPLGLVTSKCNSMAEGTESVASCAYTLGIIPMSAAVATHHTRFMQIVFSDPIGIEISLIGIVSTERLLMFGKIVATSIPIFFTYILSIH